VCSGSSTTALTTAAKHRSNADFEHRYNEIAEPLDWKFTRRDLTELLQRLDQQPTHDPPLALAA